jgi:hypothetical protein
MLIWSGALVPSFAALGVFELAEPDVGVEVDEQAVAARPRPMRTGRIFA